MGKGLLIIVLAAGVLPACGGDIGNIPADFSTYSFQASGEIMTADPQPGRLVDFNVAITSTGNTPVHCDVTLNVVAPDESQIYTQQWADVLFEPNNQWNLSNGFLPATDVEKSYSFEILVRRHDDGELMLDNKSVASLNFAN
jgi:hypothetical protein